MGGEIPPDTKIPRYEYVICGPPLEQISVAEPLASIGETVLSPHAWEHVEQSAGAPSGSVDEIGYPKKSSGHYKVSKSVLLTLYSV